MICLNFKVISIISRLSASFIISSFYREDKDGNERFLMKNKIHISRFLTSSKLLSYSEIPLDEEHLKIIHFIDLNPFEITENISKFLSDVFNSFLKIENYIFSCDGKKFNKMIRECHKCSFIKILFDTFINVILKSFTSNYSRNLHKFT